MYCLASMFRCTCIAVFVIMQKKMVGVIKNNRYEIYMKHIFPASVWKTIFKGYLQKKKKKRSPLLVGLLLIYM